MREHLRPRSFETVSWAMRFSAGRRGKFGVRFWEFVRVGSCMLLSLDLEKKIS